MLSMMHEHGKLQGDKPWLPSFPFDDIPSDETEFPFDDELTDEPEMNGGFIKNS